MINKKLFIEMDESQMKKEEELNKLRDDLEEINNELNEKKTFNFWRKNNN